MDILVRPGTKISSDTVILRLSNPKLGLEVNEASGKLAVRMTTDTKPIKLVQFILKDALLMLVIRLGLGFVIFTIGYQAMQNQLLLLPEFNLVAMSLLDVGLMLISVALPAWKVISLDPMRSLRQE